MEEAERDTLRLLNSHHPLERQDKVNRLANIDNTDTNAPPPVVLALASSSSYKTRTRTRTRNLLVQKKKNVTPIKLGININGIGDDGDGRVTARIVSPYFARKGHRSKSMRTKLSEANVTNNVDYYYERAKGKRSKRTRRKDYETLTWGGINADNKRVYNTSVDVKDEHGKDRMKEGFSINRDSQESSPLCSRNVRKKRVRSASLHGLMTEKNEGDLSLHEAQMDSDKKVCRKVKKKKRNKDKAASLTSSCLVIGLEGARSVKEDCAHEGTSCLQASTIRKVSPFFQTQIQIGDYDDKGDKADVGFPNKRMPCRILSSEFEELLSNYAYKSESMVNGRQENDCAVRKKRCATKSTYLSAKEKLSEPYQRRALHNAWRPPRSPYNLLQEDHAHDPWRILVICMLLNLTGGTQVKQVLSALFSLCPDAEAAVSISVDEIQRVIQSLGLHRKRAAMIQRFSREYLSEDWTHVTQLHGIGKYAADAYAIFVNGMWNQVTPNDHMLKYYWKFLKNRCLKPI